MRVLGACSLGGAGHLHPLVPVLDAARRRGAEVVVVGPPGLRASSPTQGSVEPGGEPPEAEIAPIRERLPVVEAPEAARLGNGELFGRLATAMLPAMSALCATWRPDVILRDPAEYASAIVACRRGVPMAQVAISLAQVEAGSIAVAAPALEPVEAGVVEALHAAPYLTRFPSRSTRHRSRRRSGSVSPVARRPPLGDWWGGSEAPLVYVTLGTVIGRLSTAATRYRTLLDAVAGLDVRVLLTVGAASIRPRSAISRRTSTSRPGSTRPTCSTTPASSCATAAPARCSGRSPPGCRSSWSRRSATRSRTAAGSRPRVPGSHRRAARRGMAPPPRRLAELIRLVLADDSYRDAARRLAAEMASFPTADEVMAGLAAPAGAGFRAG